MPLELGTLEVLAATPATLRSLLAELPTAVIERPDDGGWSALDNVAHLVDRGRIQRGRVDRLSVHPGATIEDSDERTTLEASGLRFSLLSDLLDAFSTEQLEDVAVYERLTDDRLAATGEHTVVRAISVANLIHQLAYHDLQHLIQIANVVATFPHPGRGRLAAF